MSERTMTRAVETDAAPGSVLKILEDPKRLPEWAAAFADKVERDRANTYRATKGDTALVLHVVIERGSRTVDYLRETAPGEKSGAYLRVLARPGGGSVVVMTLPVAAGRTAEEVETVMMQELEALTRLALPRAA